MKVKTIDVNGLEWFDKVNGNSYFAGIVTVNFGMKDQKKFKMPFQYGYGDSYRYEAFKTLQKEGIIPETKEQSWQYCRDNGIITRFSMKENCKQRELKNL